MRSETDFDNLAVNDVTVSSSELTFCLSDGRTVSAPIGWYPRLAAGSDAERADFRISGAGGGVHWLSLDEDVSVENLLRGQPSCERPESLREWLATRGDRVPT